MNEPTRSIVVECPAKTNLTLAVGKPHQEWSGRHELDTIYCAISLTDTVKVTEKPADTGFSLELDGTHLGDLASSQVLRAVRPMPPPRSSD